MIAIVVVTLLWLSGDSHRSAAVADITAARPAYAQVVYRVDNSATGTTVTTWEVLTRDGPFAVNDLDYTSPPGPGAPPAAGTVSTFDALFDLKAGRLYQISGRQPGVGSGDQAWGVELGDLVDRRLAEPLPQSMVVAGRRCRLFRLGEPPAGPIAPISSGSVDDLCIDAAGLLLSERWNYQGHLVLDRTATSVSLTPAGGAHPAGAPPISSALAAPSSTVLLRVSAANGHDSFLVDPPDPPGFAPQPVVSTEAFDPSQPGVVDDTTTLWSFSNGGNAITVEAGQGSLPWQAGDTPTRSDARAGLGPAVSALRSDGPEIRLPLPNNRWLRVRGTVPLQQLVAYASLLRTARGEG